MTHAYVEAADRWTPRIQSAHGVERTNAVRAMLADLTEQHGARFADVIRWAVQERLKPQRARPRKGWR